MSRRGSFYRRLRKTTWSRLSETRIGSRRDPSTCRRLRFEPLEDRRLLAIIADTFANDFAQVSLTTGSEATYLTADTAGHAKVFYRPNSELGFVDPESGDLLTADFFAQTSGVFVIDAEVTGNVSTLVGQQYTNGQLIAADGGNTLYHKDGSIMRSGGTWTYDAGATLESGANFFWSNGTAMISGATLRHPNNAVLRDSSGTISYASGTTFYNSATTALSFPGSQTLRDAAGSYRFEDGSTLKSSGTIYYPDATVMVDANGTVHNEDANISITPFARYIAFSASENQFNVSDVAAQITTAIQSVLGGGTGAYVSRQTVQYQTLPPEPLDIVVTAPDAETLRFSWTSGGGSTTGYRVAVGQGASPPNDSVAAVDTTDNFFVVPSLTPGQRITVRVWAKDAGGNLSHGINASGIAGSYLQAPQTGYLIESGLNTTFAQVYDNLSKNIIFTVDKDNNFVVFFYAGDEIGYVNPENGDRLSGSSYTVTSTGQVIGHVDDATPFGNISTIADGAHYLNVAVIRTGSTYFYDTGTAMRSPSGTWFHSNGNILKSAAGYFWSNGANMRVGGNNYFSNGAPIKAGTSIVMDNGTTFFDGTSAFYATGASLRNSSGELFYESGTQLFSNNAFRYFAGATMIDSVGAPYLSNGTPADVPFDQSNTFTNSNEYVSLDADAIARYAVTVRRTTSNYILGGTVDYPARNGDYTRDDTADAADYVLGRMTQGSTFNLAADGNANGTIDAGDQDVWRAHFGNSLPAAVVGASSEERAATAAQNLVSAPVATFDTRLRHDLVMTVNSELATADNLLNLEALRQRFSFDRNADPTNSHSLSDRNEDREAEVDATDTAFELLDTEVLCAL